VECGKFTFNNPSENAEIITSTVPDLKEDIIAPLAGAGYSMEEIEHLGGRKKLTW